MNEFVAYLNSINNLGGNATGSLAETQVKTKYFDMIKIDRRLGDYIADSVRNQLHRAFILTGHAGDGKTSILVQVLKRLNYLSDGDGLQEEGDFPDFYYVKDMSEIAEERQMPILEKALSAPHNRKTSLLISNTGPLLQAFTDLENERKASLGESFTEANKIELQSTLLKQLDSNDDKEVVLSGYSFMLINIARVDNVGFAAKILNKIIDKDLWRDCATCPCGDRCPIINNVKLVFQQYDRVSAFVENYYRFLYENDKRMTIRQMVGQLSYALTGNLSCEYIESKFLKEPFLNYNFANLFFGFYGIDEKQDAVQIKGVEQIRTLGLDAIALDVDYRLFVAQDYSFFHPDIQELLKGLSKKYRKHYQLSSRDLVISPSEQKTEMQLRRAVRRFYLVFSLCEDKITLNNIFNQIFGANYTDYCQIISGKVSRPVLRKLQSTVFQALYMKNTGAVPDGQTELPLTLRREDDVFQNVMLVLGMVSKNDLEIVQVPNSNSFEDNTEKQTIYLKLKKDLFKITLPMVNYFQSLIAGSISSNNNPALTHGIATLDALLLDNYGDGIPDSEEDCELRVIINTTSGQEFETLSFADNRLNMW